MNHEDVVRAEELVVADRRAGDPTLSYEDALVDAVDAVGRVPVYGDDALADAYRLVRATRVPPTRAELLALTGALARRVDDDRLRGLDVTRRAWLWQLRRGVLP